MSDLQNFTSFAFITPEMIREVIISLTNSAYICLNIGGGLHEPMVGVFLHSIIICGGRIFCQVFG